MQTLHYILVCVLALALSLAVVKPVHAHSEPLKLLSSAPDLVSTLTQVRVLGVNTLRDEESTLTLSDEQLLRKVPNAHLLSKDSLFIPPQSLELELELPTSDSADRQSERYIARLFRNDRTTGASWKVRISRLLADVLESAVSWSSPNSDKW